MVDFIIKIFRLMNSSDVTRLRKNGQLDEAHQLALQLMAEHPDDIWNRRAYAWVLYALMKRDLEAGLTDAAKAHFSDFEALQMPADETMLHDNFGHYQLRFHAGIQKAEALSAEKCYAEALDLLWNMRRSDPDLAGLPDLQYKIAWEIWHNLRALPPDTGPALRHVQELTGMYRQLSAIKKPDLVHSVILSELLRLPPAVKQNFDFSDWFRFWIIPDHFSEKDLLPYVTKDAQWPSLAEKACNAWSKALVENAARMPAPELEAALHRLEDMAQAHTGFVWLPYFIGKIRLAGAAGDQAAARAWLTPFVKQKHTEFWAWDLLADAWSKDDPALAQDCLCKALICRTEPHFLAKVRLKLIQSLIRKADYNHARYEVETLIRLKQEREEPLPGDLIRLPQAPWYADAVNEGAQAQNDWYRLAAVRAEELVFADEMLLEVGVVEGMDRNTGAVYFALRPDVRGRFPAKRFPKMRFQPGDVFLFKLLKKIKNDRIFWEILALEPTREMPSPEICRDFKGPFLQFGQQPVGKVADAFVPAHIVRALDLQNGQPASVRVVWAFDPKRQAYGWKAVGAG